jgi:glycine/D-amino acid oxidase-like deaminating enzyme/nitrite reductase/ring-hydroxylating ferredoxin subunit
VALIEDGIIGSGETSRTSAHLSSCLDTRYFELIDKFGEEQARLAAQSHKEAINYIEKVVNTENISCNFKRVPGYLFAHENNNKSKGNLEKEAQALTTLGNIPWDWSQKAPFAHYDTGRCIKYYDQAQFDPDKYLRGLADAVVKHGGAIYEATHAKDIKDGAPCEITTSDKAHIKAKNIIIATGSPINDRLLIQTKQAQYRTYVIGISILKNELAEALYWDDLEAYHYVRHVHAADQEKIYVLIGGEDHKTGQKKMPRQAFAALEQWAKERFTTYELLYQWSGQVIEPVDSLAFIGKNPLDQHIFIHTGHSGNGLTYAAIAAELLANLINNTYTAYEKIYEPSRKNIKAAGVYLKETGNMMIQYSDWLEPAQKKIEELATNDGAIIRDGLSLEAVYKDEQGDVHRLSAVCPHLGGIVRWNNLEKSWDCPCHGSRFSATGEVLNGPANKNLKKIMRKK